MAAPVPRIAVTTGCRRVLIETAGACESYASFAARLTGRLRMHQDLRSLPAWQALARPPAIDSRKVLNNESRPTAATRSREAQERIDWWARRCTTQRLSLPHLPPGRQQAGIRTD